MRIESHAQEANTARMRALYQCISHVAIIDPHLFAETIKGGLRTNSVGLPTAMKDRFIFSTNDVSSLFLDRWSHPFNLSIRPVVSTNKQKAVYQIILWSSGPNGIDENGKGDDIPAQWDLLEVPLE